jgi:hypothetical protein
MENEKELVKDWIEKVVIGLNFCPFAAKPFHLDKIIYLVHIEQDILLYIKQFYAVLRELQEEPAEVIETAFIIYPHSFADFHDYLSFVVLLQAFLEKNQFEEEFQLASFHPSYQFEGSQPSDLSNVTNRSPFPLIHIIRTESIQQARLFYGDTLNIPEKNIANLNALGVDGWNSFCEDNQLPYLAKK